MKTLSKNIKATSEEEEDLEAAVRRAAPKPDGYPKNIAKVLKEGSLEEKKAWHLHCVSIICKNYQKLPEITRNHATQESIESQEAEGDQGGICNSESKERPR